jgi:ATP-binding cassette subfamily B protein
MISQSSALPLSAPALRSVTDHAIAGRAGPATLAALIVAVLVIASLTAGHFAHIFYFELGDMIVHRLERELMALSNDSAGLEHHERPDYADKLQVLRQELFRAGWGSMEALLSSIGLAVAMVITGFLLGMLNPLLLLLPFAAAPPLLLGRRAEALLAAGRERAAEPNRRARHVFKMTTDAGPAKELRACGLEQEMRTRQADAWETATRILLAGEVRGAVLRIAGQLVFAVAYVAATLVVVGDAVAGHRTVGDVILAISLAAQVNQQVTAAVNLLQELQRIAKTLADFRWIKELVARSGSVPDDATLPDRITAGITLRDIAFEPYWRASTCTSRPGPRSLWWARTAPARPPWSSCSAGSTRPPRVPSSSTGPTCAASRSRPGGRASPRVSRTSRGSSCWRVRRSASAICPTSTRPAR